MRYTEEIRFRENAAVGWSLEFDQRSARACIASRAVEIGKENGLQTGAAQRKVIALNPFTHGIAARVETYAGNLLMAMFDQMPHALFCAFSILDQHRIRLQSSKRPVESDNRNAAFLNHLQSSSVFA